MVSLEAAVKIARELLLTLIYMLGIGMVTTIVLIARDKIKRLYRRRDGAAQVSQKNICENPFFHFRPESPIIKLVGTGGAGINIMDHMIDGGLNGVEFVAIDTDANAVQRSKASRHLFIGETLTRGMGSGGDSEVSRRAIEESREQVKDMLWGSDMVILIAGMGGGVGTGIAPVVGEIAMEMGALTLGLVTMPMEWEGTRRNNLADQGITRIKKHVDTLFPIQLQPFRNLLLRGQPFMHTLWDESRGKVSSDPCSQDVLSRHENLSEAYKWSDEFLMFAVRGIVDLIMVPSLIQFNFNDAKTVFASHGGESRQGIVRLGLGENGEQAAQHAIQSQHLCDAPISGAKSCLVGFSAANAPTPDDTMDAMDHITRATGCNAILVWGTYSEPALSADPALSGASMVILHAMR